MKKYVKIYLVFLIGILLSCSTNGVSTTDNNLKNMGDPSACYCERTLGYEYDIKDGSCILSNNKKVNAWAFFRGEVAQEHSYCAQKGYKIIIDTISNDAGLKTACPFCIKTNEKGDTLFKMTQYELMRMYGDTCAYRSDGKGM